MQIIRLETVDSTNAYARRHFTTFLPHEITAIIADQQTAGRGRLGRTWASPAGVNLYVTFALEVNRNDLMVSLGVLLAHSMTQVLIREGLFPLIKWPNDIQINQKKVAGVLCEVEENRCFLGIGLNVNMEEDLSLVSQSATSLKIATQRNWSRERLFEQLCFQFSYDLSLFLSNGLAPFQEVLQGRLAYLGKRVRITHDTLWIEGICHSIHDQGMLNLLTPDGIQSIRTGTLRLVD